jgi:hypothetical protein
MKALARRVHRLEERFGSKPERDFVRDPAGRLRVVVSRIDRPLNLAASTCTRKISATGFLSEVVRLDGSAKDLSREGLDDFVCSFPVTQDGERIR